MTATDQTRKRRLDAMLGALNTPVSGQGLAAFRLLFGLLLVVSVARFARRGWIDELLVAPAYHFTYLGFDWVRPLPAWGMHALFAFMGAAALGIALGFRTRTSAAVFFLTFTYAELIDKATYLNHYYFVSLVAALLVVLPASRPAASVGNWAYVLLRAQVAVVYVFAGFAKLNADWLLHAQPLATWLQAHTDLPLIGRWLGTPAAAYAMSWGGALFDLGVVPLLLWRRTRPLAYAACVVFHLSVGLLFPIGVFPWVMIVAATSFFAPDWPAKLRNTFRLPSFAGSEPRARANGAALSRAGLCLAALYLTVQVAVPLRFLIYPGNVNWTEEAFRFSWRVMLIEKTGSVEYRVVTPRRTFLVQPRAELTALQYKMLSTQPDMIHAYAHTLADRFAAEGPVRVYAESWASLNGRPSQRLIDPAVDLAGAPRSLLPQPFIVPLGQQAEAALATAH